MAMGRRRKQRQGQIWVEEKTLVKGPSHPFYQRLNEVLERHGFDGFIEGLAAKFYAPRFGRPSLPPPVYFRLLLIGYFEGIDSERGIAWRVADSFALREFLGLALTESPPDHSTISRNRRLLELEAHQEAFTWVLGVLAKEGVLRGKTLGIDATTLEANAALRSIVRRDTGASYEEFLRGLASASGIETPTREDLAKLDRKRAKKGSNKEWTNPYDPDAKITKMKDGRTHLAHKAEHAVDMETGAVVAVTLQPADRGDTESFEETLDEAMGEISDVIEDEEAGEALSDQVVAEVVADKGYHSNAVLAARDQVGIRTYISEPKRGRRNWQGKAAEKVAVYGNRRRIRGERGKRLLRRRGELMERSFAHCYETGGMRRTHLRGHRNILKRLLVHVAGFNLGLVMRKVFGIGKPRVLQGLRAALLRLVYAFFTAICTCFRFRRSRALSSEIHPAGAMSFRIFVCAAK
ncbi:MAG TPA: transposase [Thermoanaerobaculia bacterium]|nr:transposase [Thermoanaerobaculia bacterium]